MSATPWSVPPERSGDGALMSAPLETLMYPQPPRRESRAALRWPPHSKPPWAGGLMGKDQIHSARIFLPNGMTDVYAERLRL
jgi:hypothetical protein